MSTLAEIEKAVPQFWAEEMAELEQFIRRARREKERVGKSSLRDIEPVSVGRILQSLGMRDESNRDHSPAIARSRSVRPTLVFASAQRTTRFWASSRATRG